jgi:hypothetical protein
VKRPVSGEEYRTSRTKGREFRRQSLLDEFSISEIWARERPETGCVSAETGSKPRSGNMVSDNLRSGIIKACFHEAGDKLHSLNARSAAGSKSISSVEVARGELPAAPCSY